MYKQIQDLGFFLINRFYVLKKSDILYVYIHNY